MSPPNPHILVAEHQLRAARAIVLDPTCDDRLAAGHLAAAWEALARAAGDAPVLPDSFVPQASPTPADGRTPPVPSDSPTTPAPTHSLAPRPEDRAALTPSLAAAIDPVLPALLAERDASPLALRPWGVPHALLERHCDALAAILARRGDASARPRVWLKRAGVLAGLLGLALLALRPWQSEGFGPWAGTYFSRPDFTGQSVQRRDLDLSFDWSDKPPMDSIPADRYSVRWDTCLTVPTAVVVPFQLVSDDGSRLFLDGRLVLDNWGKHQIEARGARLDLAAGEHHLRVEYFEDRGEASVALLASFDGEAPAAIPRSMLRAPEGGDDGPCG